LTEQRGVGDVYDSKSSSFSYNLISFSFDFCLQRLKLFTQHSVFKYTHTKQQIQRRKLCLFTNPTLEVSLSIKITIIASKEFKFAHETFSICVVTSIYNPCLIMDGL
jgi:hypothetical protein